MKAWPRNSLDLTAWSKGSTQSKWVKCALQTGTQTHSTQNQKNHGNDDWYWTQAACTRVTDGKKLSQIRNSLSGKRSHRHTSEILGRASSDLPMRHSHCQSLRHCTEFSHHCISDTAIWPSSQQTGRLRLTFCAWIRFLWPLRRSDSRDIIQCKICDLTHGRWFNTGGQVSEEWTWSKTEGTVQERV